MTPTDNLEPITEEEIKLLEELEEKASPTPWSERNGRLDDNFVADVRGLGINSPRKVVACGDEINFIIKSRNLLPRLLKGYRELKTQLDEILSGAMIDGKPYSEVKDLMDTAYKYCGSTKVEYFKKWLDMKFEVHKQQLAEKERVIERMQEVLKFYGDEKNYTTDTASIWPAEEPLSCYVFWNAVAKDSGEKARQCLKEIFSEEVNDA